MEPDSDSGVTATGSVERCLPPAGAHRAGSTDAARPATTGGRVGTGQRRHLDFACSAHDHGGGAPALPRQQLVGQGPAAAQGTVPAARRGHLELSQRWGRAPTARTGLTPNSGWTARWSRAQSPAAHNTLSIDSGGSGDEDAPAIVDPRRLRPQAWTRSRTGKRCGPCSPPSGAGRTVLLLGSSSR